MMNLSDETTPTKPVSQLLVYFPINWHQLPRFFFRQKHSSLYLEKPQAPFPHNIYADAKVEEILEENPEVYILLWLNFEYL